MLGQGDDSAAIVPANLVTYASPVSCPPSRPKSVEVAPRGHKDEITAGSPVRLRFCKPTGAMQGLVEISRQMYRAKAGRMTVDAASCGPPIRSLSSS